MGASIPPVEGAVMVMQGPLFVRRENSVEKQLRRLVRRPGVNDDSRIGMRLCSVLWDIAARFQPKIGCRRPEPLQLCPRVFGVEPVRDVASWRQARQFEDADARGDKGETGRDGEGMVAPSIIVVGYDDHVTTMEIWVKFGPPLWPPRLLFVPPLGRSASIASGGEPKLGEIVGILLALDEEDAGVERSGD